MRSRQTTFQNAPGFLSRFGNDFATDWTESTSPTHRIANAASCAAGRYVIQNCSALHRHTISVMRASQGRVWNSLWWICTKTSLNHANPIIHLCGMTQTWMSIFGKFANNKPPVAPQSASILWSGIDMIVKIICIVAGLCIWEAIKHAAIWLYRKVKRWT